MKNYFHQLLFLALGLAFGAVPMSAQYDDLYYDPSQDYETFYGSSYSDNSRGDEYSASEGGYDDQSYDAFYDDQYDYQYSSRIRRFHRSYYGFDFYDPVYVDNFFYDPFWTPGVTVLIYDDPWGFRGWNRWNRWNRWGGGWNNWGWGWNNWGWNRWNRWNSWNHWDPWFGAGFNNNFFYTNNYFINDPFWGGGFNNYYCPPTWGNGYTYNNITNINNTYYGPRRGGADVSGRERIRGRETLVNDRPDAVAGKEPRQEPVSGVAPDGRDQVTRQGDLRTLEESPSRGAETRTQLNESPDRTRDALQFERSRSAEERANAIPTERPQERAEVRREINPRTPSRSDMDRTRSRNDNYRSAPPSNRNNNRSYDPGRSRNNDRSYNPGNSRSNDRTRSYSPPSRSNNDRSYNRGNNSSSPSRSYNNSSSRSSSPSMSRGSSGSSRSSSPGSRSGSGSSRSGSSRSRGN